MLELKVIDGSREVVLKFEHSLLSVSKWEANHKKSFLASPEKLATEMIDYFRDMLVSPEDKQDLVYALSTKQQDQLLSYINDTHTAATVPDDPDAKRGPKEHVTSDLIYYQMVALRIPFQPTETWHLNRLMMLIQITAFKQKPEKKKSKSQALADWVDINRKNRDRFNSNG